MTHTTENIRNLALVGSAGAGKTTLSEALLHAAGMTSHQGSIEQGDTVSDFTSQEKNFGHSLEVALLYLETGDARVHLLDTPGYPDLTGRAISILPAVETAAVVIDATAGIDPVAEQMMKLAARRDLDRLIIINKIDSGADLAALMADIQAQFGSECLPLNLPADGGQRVVDCFFRPEYDAAVDFSSVREAHDTMVDQVVEMDEELMEVYLEQEKALKPDQLHDPFEAALREGHLVPVCFVSARTGAGVDLLLETFRRLMPNPAEGNPPPYLKGEGEAAKAVEVQPDAERHAIAHVFRISNDPYRGKLAVFRLHQGTITPNSQLFIGDARKAFKVQRLFRLQGGEQIEIERAVPGDIAAVARIDELHFDAVIHDSHDEDHHHLKTVECPAPVHGIAVEPAARGDEQKLSTALHKLLDEDPCLALEQTRGETVLRGMGGMHLNIVLERIKEQYGVEIHTRPPTVPYRETITRKAEGHCRHKKQTGGAGQFGEVYLRIEPLPAGSGFEFVNEVHGGTIPSVFIPAVEKGVREAMTEGVVAGFPVHDVRVAVYDGKSHPVDGKEIAFVTAGRKAFQEAALAARPVVLEPFASLVITIEPDALGAITGDMSSRRGQILGTEHTPSGKVKLSVEVPLSEVLDYESTLKSLTGGAGRYTLSLSRYQPVPARVQETLASAYERKDED